MTCLQLANQIGLFFSSTTVPMPQSGCFIIQLPRRVLCVYWLGYLPGSVFQEQAPSCVPALIYSIDSGAPRARSIIGLVGVTARPYVKPLHVCQCAQYYVTISPDSSLELIEEIEEAILQLTLKVFPLNCTAHPVLCITQCGPRSYSGMAKRLYGQIFCASVLFSFPKSQRIFLNKKKTFKFNHKDS